MHNSHSVGKAMRKPQRKKSENQAFTARDHAVLSLSACNCGVNTQNWYGINSNTSSEEF